MRRGRRREPREIVAALEHGNQPAAGVFIGDFEHHAREIGEILIGKREAPQRIAEARIEPRRSQNQVRLKVDPRRASGGPGTRPGFRCAPRPPETGSS